MAETTTLILAQDSTATAPADAGATAPAETHAGTEEASSVGMPQLDPTTFEPQLVWLAISFILLLILMWGVALPRVRRILVARERKMAEDLDRAEKLKTDADAALADYNRALAEGRAKGREAMRQATAEAAEVVAAREAAFAQSLKQRLDEAQQSIQSAKAAALNDLKAVATDVAASATVKLGGVELPRERVAAAVDQAMARRTAAPAGA
jgi:F-type H+-transporting ATPase subunit b